MNKLRENLENAIPDYNALADKHIDQLEQITDDFSVQLLIWMTKLKPNSDEVKNIDFNNSSDEKIATELQQYFKENVYGK